MSAVPDTIEAEVLEIDGSPAPPPSQQTPPNRAEDAWRSMRGRVVRLDRRWWPLWILLGIVALVLLAVVACFVAVFVVVAKILGGILRLFTGGGASRSGTGLSRRSFRKVCGEGGIAPMLFTMTPSAVNAVGSAS